MSRYKCRNCGASLSVHACEGASQGITPSHLNVGNPIKTLPFPKEDNTEDQIMSILIDNFPRIGSGAHLEAAQSINQLLHKAKIEELDKLTNHREFIYWGDGASSDLDKYLKDRINELKELE